MHVSYTSDNVDNVLIFSSGAITIFYIGDCIIRVSIRSLDETSILDSFNRLIDGLQCISVVKCLHSTSAHRDLVGVI